MEVQLAVGIKDDQAIALGQENVSRLATAALVEELDRLAKIAMLHAYLERLADELGPIPPTMPVAAAGAGGGAHRSADR